MNNKKLLLSLVIGLIAAIVSVTIFFLVENKGLSISLIIAANTFFIMSVGAKEPKK